MRLLKLLALLPFAAAFVGLADPLLDRHVKGLQAAQSVEATLSVTQVGGATEEHKLAFSRPNHFRYDSPQVLLLSDGTRIVRYDKGKKVYSETAATDDEIKRMLTSAEAIWAWSAFFDASFGNGFGVKKGSPRKVRNVGVTDLVVARKDQPAATLFVEDETGLVRGLTWVAELGGVRAETIVFAKELVLGDKPLAESVFAWTAPADAKSVAEAAAAGLRFADIKPILDQHCVSCHTGPEAKDGILFTSYQGLMAAKIVSPGKPDSSKLVRVVRSGKMPPAGPLPKADVDKLAQWVADGANE